MHSLSVLATPVVRFRAGEPTGVDGQLLGADANGQSRPIAARSSGEKQPLNA